jgi:membrane-bound lytic murein transglycosylase
MFVRKSKISSLIKKERQRERELCEKESSSLMDNELKRIENEHKKSMKEVNEKYRKLIITKDKEITKLQREINKNYTKYQTIRRREKQLDEMTVEFEDVVRSMSVKMQETLQPFYRTRSKIEHAKRKSDKNNEKVESIFKAAK